jgi:RNA polymerase sigma-70 factor (ECF subfamily)
MPGQPGIDEDPDEPEENEFEKILAGVTTDKMMVMICNLPVGYRTVFNLYVFEDYQHKEIARELSISENTSKSQLSKARGMLKKQILGLVNKEKAIS